MYTDSLTYYCDNNRHLVCKPFSVENLHIKRSWYHSGKHPHYDIPKSRIDEIANLCQIVSTREIYRIIHNK